MSRANVPAAWYSLSARLGATAAVADAISAYIPCGEQCRPIMQELDSVGALTNAVEELLRLCREDCNRLERALLDS